MERTKFNVGKGKEDRTYNGIVFDSQLEMKYYRDVLLPKVESGEVVNYELQKKYILQDGFERNGKKILPITYIADFYIEYSDGRAEVVDTKGMPDSVAQIKRKMFWRKYPDIEYNWMVNVKKFGGWITYEQAQAMRRKEKRIRNKKEDAKYGESN